MIEIVLLRDVVHFERDRHLLILLLERPQKSARVVGRGISIGYGRGVACNVFRRLRRYSSYMSASEGNKRAPSTSYDQRLGKMNIMQEGCHRPSIDRTTRSPLDEPSAEPLDWGTLTPRSGSRW